MKAPVNHFIRCMVAGVVALLPLGGAVFAIVWLEDALSSSWRAKLGSYYFPGLGLMTALAVTYLVGLFVTTFVGRWLWRRTDRLLQRVPLIGSFYQSLKEVLGYDSAKGRFFQGMVAVHGKEGYELGFVTGETTGPDGNPHTLVFVPGSPNPTSGRLLLIETTKLQRLDVRTADAMRALVSIGKTPLKP